MGISPGRMNRDNLRQTGHAKASDGNQTTGHAKASDGDQMKTPQNKTSHEDMNVTGHAKASDGDQTNDSPDKASDICERKKWRNDGYNRWDDKAVLGLKEDINKCIEDLQSLHDIEIILCGGTGEGKSSLINNCMAALTGAYDIVARHAQGDTQVTVQYKVVQAWIRADGTPRKLPLMFSDTRGFSESKEKGAPVEAIKACILGNVNHDETIDPKVSDAEWKERKKVKCKASYIFLVADANMVPNDGLLQSARSKRHVYENMREIIQFSNSEGLAVAAFLTMCDRLDSEIQNDVSNLHYSNDVEKKVKAFHKIFGIPENRIFPVVNYTGQLLVTNEMAIQMLIALRSCLQDIRGVLWTNPK